MQRCKAPALLRFPVLQPALAPCEDTWPVSQALFLYSLRSYTHLSIGRMNMMSLLHCQTPAQARKPELEHA